MALVKPQLIDSEALRTVAAKHGHDTVRGLAAAAGISEWGLYRGLRAGVLKPSDVIALRSVLDTDEFLRQNAS